MDCSDLAVRVWDHWGTYAQACIMDGTIATTTITIYIDLDDHQFIKQIVESLLYAVEYTRKYSTDVKALVFTHCLVQI